MTYLSYAFINVGTSYDFVYLTLTVYTPPTRNSEDITKEHVFWLELILVQPFIIYTFKNCWLQTEILGFVALYPHSRKTEKSSKRYSRDSCKKKREKIMTKDWMKKNIAVTRLPRVI